MQLRTWTFAALRGWGDDDHAKALTAFRRSCEKILSLPSNRPIAEAPGAPGGLAGQWRVVCTTARNLGAVRDAGARRFFETWFVPYEVRDAHVNGTMGHGPDTGLFTGYFEPQLSGSRTRGGRFQVPLLARPDDLVSMNLRAFDGALGGNTLWGRVRAGRLVPYFDRAAIEEGVLGSRAKALLWVDNAVDAFFLQVQGSGRVRLQDGTLVRVGFAGKNGRPYKSIGRILIDRGDIPAARLSMASIRSWVQAHRVQGAALLKQNPSYVFFRLLPQSDPRDGPVGAEGVALTPGRSLAVDRRYLPLGAPLWVETTDPLDAHKALRRLMVAQDVGGAIRGVVRGDIFFGAGQRAARRAGHMKRTGRYFILLPYGVTPAAP